MDSAISNEEFNESFDEFVRKVQAELDFLRSSIAQENSVGESPCGAPLHPTVRQCNEALEDIRHAAARTNGESSLFCEFKSGTKHMSTIVDGEILQSYHLLKDLNSRLSVRIQKEQQRLSYLQNVLNEHLEIKRALEESKLGVDTTALATTRDQFLYDTGINIDNAQLHDDLLYITNCIEEKFLNKIEEFPTQQSQYKPLHELIPRFIKQRMDCPDQPYVDLSALTTEFHPKHIQLLREALILESNQRNSNQMALVDYTQNDAYQV